MSSAVRRVAVATLLGISLCPPFLRAEDTGTPAAADPAMATPAPPASAAEPDVSPRGADAIPPVVVSATRFDTSIETAPVNVTLITADELAQSHAQNLAQALEQLANVHVVNLYGITGGDARVDLAGFGATGAANTLVLVNGRRLNEIDSTGANLDAIPLDSVARIEIVRGSSSVLYGDNATGGIINIVTKTGFDAPRATVRVNGGSFGTRGLNASGRWAGAGSAVYVSAGARRSDGYRDYNAAQASTLFAEYTHLGESAAFGARIGANRETLELPGAIDESAYRDDPTAANAYPYDTRAQQRSAELFYKGDALAAEIAARRKNSEFDYGAGNVSEADLRTLSFTPRWRATDETSEFIAGLDLYRSTQDSETHATWGDSGNDITHRTVAAYFSDSRHWFEKVSFNYGARYQRLDLEISNSDAFGTTKDETDDHAVAWDAAVVLKYAPGAKGYVRVARSFRFANIDEYCYYCPTIVALDAQTGRHLEAGFEAPLNDAVRIELQIFNIALKNEIAWDNSQFANINLDDTRHTGANLGVSAQLMPRWSVRFNHSYRNAEFSAGANDGNTIPEVPSHKWTLANRIDFADFGVLMLDAHHTGARYFGDDFGNEGKRLPGYSVVNLGYRYAAGPVAVRVSIDNLLDEKAADAGYYRPLNPEPYSYYPLPERALYVAVDATL